MTAPVFFIKKKNSSLYLVQDYRSPNIVTVRNKYLLSLISKLVIVIRQKCGQTLELELEIEINSSQKYLDI